MLLFWFWFGFFFTCNRAAKPRHGTQKILDKFRSLCATQRVGGLANRFGRSS